LAKCSDDTRCVGTNYDSDNDTCLYYFADENASEAASSPTASRTPSSNSTASATGNPTRSAGITGGAGNSTSSSLATASPTVAPTCSLVPRLPNGGFEDGKNQTAWVATGGYVSSWAPTTTNPYDGALSGQFTFEPTEDYSRASIYLVNTMSNLCQGFNYSISYHSFCNAQESEYCYVSVTTSEAYDDERGYFSATEPGTGWLAEDDVFSFTAASSTSTLYLYVGTVTDNQGVGNVYLDDFRIRLLGSKEDEI